MTHAGNVAAAPPHGSLDFNRRPLLVFWETTRACLLACRHCRASAMARPQPGELSRDEGLSLIAQVTEFGRPYPILVLTGGDVLMRPDVYDLLATASAAGIPTCVAPSVTPRLTKEAVRRIADAGARAVSISVDGADAHTHESIRGVAGLFGQTLEAITWLVDAGLRVQINTTVMKSNVDELADVAALVRGLGARMWEVFFLVGVGRGARLSELEPAVNEDVCHFLFDASHHGFVVRTVEAPFFRRIAAARRAWRQPAGGLEDASDVRAEFGLGETYARLRSRLDDTMGAAHTRPAAHTVSTRDGKGIVFVAHDGEVYPAGFLPLAVGSVKDGRLVDIYRESPLLRDIRTGQFHGRCGQCAHHDLCGGSRARAYVNGGDPLGEDPACMYAPGG